MKKNENNVTCDTDVNVLSVRYYLMLKIPLLSQMKVVSF